MSSTLTATFDDIIFEQEEEGFKAGPTLLEHDKTVYPDTVLVRLSQVDYNSYLFWRSVEYQASSNGNPFAEPINLQSNLSNGYGVFYGQAAVYYKPLLRKTLHILKDTTHLSQKYYKFTI